MRKVLIVSDSTRVGGIQKSLINMLNLIDYKKYSIDLLLFNDNHTESINNNVKILPSNKLLRIIGSTSEELNNANLLDCSLRKILSFLCRVFGSNFIFSFLYKFISIDGKYDVAISYSNNVNEKSMYFGYNKFVIERVKAYKKKCWIHVDYLSRKRTKIEEQEFLKMDEIILVSNACKRNFEMVYPEFRNKTRVVYNMVNRNDIIKQSDEKISNEIFDGNVFKIISIGRIEKNKNINSQILIAYKLKQAGLKFKWYVIGNGNDFIKIKKEILKLNIDDCFLLLGEKKNVYPYINSSSLLVSTSLSESFGLTIVEALMLNVPILALNYPTLKELVPQDCICDDVDQLYQKILLMLKNKKVYNSYRSKCQYLINNSIVIKQINDVLGD